MLELETQISKINSSREYAKIAFRIGRRDFHKAEEAYRKAEELRQQILQEILNQKGLAVCSAIHSTEKDISNPSAEQLGIYPINNMRLLYREDGPYTRQGEYEDSIVHIISLNLYCPEHFPKNENWSYVKSGKYTNARSEVILENQRYILSVNGKDITRLVENGGPDIDPKGKRIFLIDQAVYRYFGIPDLPEKPDFGSIQYGR